MQIAAETITSKIRVQRASSNDRRVRRPSGAGMAACDGALQNPLSIFAHDMRGPLANLQILLDGVAGEVHGRPADRASSLLAKAQNIVESLEELLLGMLERAREHGDPLAFDPGIVDLADLVETVIELNRPLAERHGARLQAYLVEPLEVWGDRLLLMQALDNLLNNAIKHTPGGGLVLCEVAREHGRAVIRIQDEGPGFSDDDLLRAFSAFTRLSARAQGSSPSCGLGLWIVRLIAERHAGKVRATNRVDRSGAIFTLSLPVAAKP